MNVSLSSLLFTEELSSDSRQVGYLEVWLDRIERKVSWILLDITNMTEAVLVRLQKQ